MRSTPGARLWSSGKRMLSKNALAVALNAAQPEVLVMVLLPRLLARAADDDCCFEDVGTKRKRPFSKVRPSPWLVMLFIVTTIARTSSDVHTTPNTSKPMSAGEISDPPSESPPQSPSIKAPQPATKPAIQNRSDPENVNQSPSQVCPPDHHKRFGTRYARARGVVKEVLGSAPADSLQLWECLTSQSQRVPCFVRSTIVQI